MPRGLKTKVIGGAVLSAALVFGAACSPLADILKQKKAEHPAAALADDKPVTASSIRWMLLEKDNDSAAYDFNLLIENPNFKPEMLPKIDLILEKADKNSGPALRALDSLLNNPNFKPEMLDDGFIQKFVEVTNLVWRGDYLVPDYLILLEKSRFMPMDTLDIAKLVIEKTEGQEINFVLQSVISIQNNSNFNPEMLDFVKLLIEKSGKEADPALDALASLLGNPNFIPAVLTEEFAEKLAETVELILEKNGGKEGAAFIDLHYLNEILENPNFRPEMLYMVYFYVEKVDAGSLLHILRSSLDKSGLEMDKESAEKLVKILNFIIDNTDENNREDALAFFNSIQKHPNFSPEMLDVVGYIIEKMSKTVGLDRIQQTGRILKMVLDDSDPSEICTMEFAENFSEAVIALTEKSNEIGCDTLGLLEAWVGNPNFESATLNSTLAKDLIDVLHFALIPSYKGNELDDGEKAENSRIMFELEILLSRSKFILKGLGILEEIGGSDALSALNGLLDNPDFTIKTYDKMDEVQLELSSTEVKLNFAYAFSTIGKEKTMVLYEKYGIEYFGRYSKEMLEEAYVSLVPEYKKDRPLLVVVFNKYDLDGAFYHDRETLDGLRRYYKVMLFETDSEKDFNKIIKKTANHYKKIDALIIGGHGQEDRIELGFLANKKHELDNLDLTDKNELKKLKKYFVSNPTVILYACFTGHGKKSLGKLLSKIWGATVWAPDKSTAVKELILTEEGKLESATYYDDAIKKFVNGKTQD